MKLKAKLQKISYILVNVMNYFLDNVKKKNYKLIHFK